MTSIPLFIMCSGAEHLTDGLEKHGYKTMRLAMNYDRKRKFPNTDVYTRIDKLEDFGENGLKGYHAVVVQSATYGVSKNGEEWTTADRLFELLQVLSVIGMPFKVEQLSHKQFKKTSLPPASEISVFFLLYPCSLQDKIFRTGESNSSK
ncbi:MAG: hypothetical protein ACTSVM_07000, partial [Candidatus Ranarchaeia archaeon]